MRRLWLIFAQSVTVCLAALLVLQTLQPDLLGSRLNTITVRESQPTVVTRPQLGSYSEAAQKAMPAVVNIFTTKEVPPSTSPLLEDPLFRHFFGDQLEDQPQRDNSLGSGVIVSSEGLILTNHHVVEAADEIEVALADGRTAPARVVGSDPETDLAVLKLEMSNLPSITFAHTESLRVGDVVLAIGNPFGVGQTVTQGIVSALGRSHLGINTFENFIQTDAPINPGNSGGALIDTSGNLVGVNSAIYSRSGGSMGIGFAIPANLAQQIMEQIVHQGSVTRGWVGVEAQDITPELADSFKLKEPRGALIAGVLRGGPADNAGVKPGDVLIEINGNKVADSSSMLNLISALKPGDAATLKVVRNESELSMRIVAGKRPLPKQRTN
jgi:serine protease DegQ